MRLADGTVSPADAVLVAVGAAPEHRAGRGGRAARWTTAWWWTPTLRTEDPDIFAAGDVARAYTPCYKQRIRVEHWANALNQPAVAAASMLGEHGLEYTRLPYFFTDQYDLGMEYVGYSEPAATTRWCSAATRTPASSSRSGSRERRVLAGMNVNVWDVVDEVRALILGRAEIDMARLKDPGVPLAEVAA